MEGEVCVCGWRVRRGVCGWRVRRLAGLKYLVQEVCVDIFLVVSSWKQTQLWWYNGLQSEWKKEAFQSSLLYRYVHSTHTPVHFTHTCPLHRSCSLPEKT